VDTILTVVDGFNAIYPDSCAFMPNRVPLVVLDGWSDKRIEETLKAIREARAHPDFDPNAKIGKKK
jgi:hypothetical protein